MQSSQATPKFARMTIASDISAPERPLKPALLRGWRRRCPQCGVGPMMKGYLQVHDSCPICGEDLHHHRADDGPSYITILVLGHLAAPILSAIYFATTPDPFVLSAVSIVIVVAAALWMLPRVKGAFVALQWAKRMHGFARTRA